MSLPSLKSLLSFFWKGDRRQAPTPGEFPLPLCGGGVGGGGSYGMFAPLAQLWIAPFCAPVIVPSFFRPLV